MTLPGAPGTLRRCRGSWRNRLGAGGAGVVLLVAGCGSATRHRMLTTFFDGVPPPRQGPVVAAPAINAATVGPRPRVGASAHGPYAAKLCGACHSASASNTFVVPRDQLCFQCHAIAMDKKHVHGPLASGGCLVCHDPHSSRFRYLLVSESDSFCLDCHDRVTVARIPGHESGTQQCTECHDPHMSDKDYLLR